MRGGAAAAALVVVGAVFVVLAILYAVGGLNLLASPAPHHYKHALVSLVVAVAALIAANFARRSATSV